MEGSKVELVSLDGVYEGLIYNSRSDKLSLEKGIITEPKNDAILMLCLSLSVLLQVVKRR